MTHERSRRGWWFSAWTTLVAAVGFLHVADDSGADQPKIEPKPINILLIVADDLRADVMSVYGGPVKTPQLERLAAGGTLFRRATCGYPICHVSRSEMLTGRVLVSEAAKGGAVSFAKSWTLWPQRMKDAGWHTVHLGKWHVDGTPQSCGYTQHAAMYGIGKLVDLPLTFPLSATGKRVTGYVGWIFKDDDNRPLPELGVGLTPGTDDRISDGAAEVIRQRTNEALFVHVNLTAPHDPPGLA